MMLEEWFEDPRLFHIVGFLIQQNVGISTLREKSVSCTKSEFDGVLRQMIFQRAIVRGKALADSDKEELNEVIAEKIGELEIWKTLCGNSFDSAFIQYRNPA